jgi:hypothetical protein
VKNEELSDFGSSFFTMKNEKQKQKEEARAKGKSNSNRQQATAIGKNQRNKGRQANTGNHTSKNEY